MAKKLRSGALAVIETPNPECLAIFATHFLYRPDAHASRAAAAAADFIWKKPDSGAWKSSALSPAVDSMPSLEELPAGVREQFFGGLDYVIFGRKL